MTYEHALRYLSEPQPPRPASPDEVEAWFPSRRRTRPLYFFFPHDKRGRAAAALFDSILEAGGIARAHVIDAREAEMRDRFMMMGRPIPPAEFSAAVSTVRGTERSARRTSEGNPKKPPFALSSADRAALSLTEIFFSEKAQIRVVILEGDADSPLLHRIADLTPGVTVAVLDGLGEGDVSAIRPDTRKVITSPCGADYHTALSGACAKRGIPLTVTHPADSRREDATIAGQTVSYAPFERLSLSCGAASFADATFLAVEAWNELNRQKIFISEDAAARGLSRTRLPDYLSPVAVEPLLLAERVEVPADLITLERDLSRMLSDGTLALPLRLLTEPRFSDLPEAASLRPMISNVDITAPDTAGTVIIVGSHSYVAPLVAAWKKERREF